MPPKTRETRSSAPTPSPAPSSTRGNRSDTRSRSRSAQTNHTDDGGKVLVKAKTVGTVEEEPEEEEEEEGEEGDEGGAEANEEEHEEGDEVEGQDEGRVANDEEDGNGEVAATGQPQGKLSMEERLAKMKELRVRMNQSTAANRKDLVSDHQKRQVTTKELARLEKQRKLAQTLRLKEEAAASGEDLERQKAWGWSIEQDERWQAKLEAEKEKGDSSYHNAEDHAHKRYNRDIRRTKADITAYERQKEAALGLAPGTLVPIASGSSASASGSGSRGLTKAEDLYRGADTLSYGDNKPSEDAIDRVTAKMNKDLDSGKRRKRKEEDTEVNYINDRNKVFNKKIARYFDKYTKEIRANFERGTAL